MTLQYRCLRCGTVYEALKYQDDRPSSPDDAGMPSS
jgi:rubredoxin